MTDNKKTNVHLCTTKETSSVLCQGDGLSEEDTGGVDGLDEGVLGPELADELAGEHLSDVVSGGTVEPHADEGGRDAMWHTVRPGEQVYERHAALGEDRARPDLVVACVLD